MNYPNYPNYNQPYFPYQPPIQQPVQQPMQQQVQQQTIQNGGFLSAPNEDFARRYPVAPGNSVTFKDEYAPYVYTKTMGFSQLDRPVFEKYRLNKEETVEEMAQEVVENKVSDEYALKTDLKALNTELSVLRDDVDNLRKQMTEKRATRAKKEDKEEE